MLPYSVRCRSRPPTASLPAVRSPRSSLKARRRRRAPQRPRWLRNAVHHVASSGIAGASTAALRRAWQSGGRDAALRAQIAVLDSLNLPYEAGQWRMKAGNVDGVLRDLEHAHNAHVTWMPSMKVHFDRPAVRRDPRFKALLARMKIAEDAR